MIVVNADANKHDESRRAVTDYLPLVYGLLQQQQQQQQQP